MHKKQEQANTNKTTARPNLHVCVLFVRSKSNGGKVKGRSMVWLNDVVGIGSVLL
jgi:hypothetical protein